MMQSWMTAGAVVVTGIIFSVIGWALKRSIFEKLDHLESKVTQFKEEMLTNYVRREDFNKNESSHEKLWTELNSIRERIAKVEEK